MKHYTDTIPQSLAEKLKERGMRLKGCTIYSHFYPQAEFRYVCTYAEVFDWLMEKGIYLYLCKGICEDEIIEWEGFAENNDKGFSTISTTWHETANATIEKALELI